MSPAGNLFLSFSHRAQITSVKRFPKHPLDFLPCHLYSSGRIRAFINFLHLPRSGLFLLNMYACTCMCANMCGFIFISNETYLRKKYICPLKMICNCTLSSLGFANFPVFPLGILLINGLSGVLFCFFLFFHECCFVLRDVNINLPFSLGIRHILIWHGLLFCLVRSFPAILKALCSLSNSPGQTPHLVFVGKVVGNRVGKTSPFQ